MRSSTFFAELFGHFDRGRLVVFSPSRRAVLLPIGPACWEQAEAAAQELAASGAEAYFGCCLVSEDDVGHGRGRASSVVAVPGFWVDIDCAAPYRKKAQNLPPTEADALALLTELPPHVWPTRIIRSGAGLHAYWLTTTPWYVTNAAEREKARDLIEHVQGLVRANAQRRGWHIDQTSDLSRVLRVPGTPNRKDPSASRLVEVVCTADGIPYLGPKVDLESWWPLVSGKAQPGPDAPAATVSASPAQGRHRLKPGETLADYVRTCVLRAKSEDKRRAAELLFAGQPYAPEGERDNATQMLTSAVVYYALEVDPDVAPEELLPIFEPSLRAWAADPDADPNNPPPDTDNVLDKLARNIVDLLPKRQQEWAEIDRKLAWGDKVVDAQKKHKVRDVLLGHGARAFRERIAGRSDEELDEGYTEADLAFFAEQQHCTVAEFRKRWVIQVGGTFWVYVNGRYETPVPQASIAQVMDKYLAPANLEWWVPKADGKGVRRKQIAELLHDYSTAAFRVESSLHLQTSYLDPRAGVFHEAVCPIRDDLDPLFVPEIDQWFRVLAGAQVEKFLDWVATVPNLERQTCALYLWGGKGTGKGMLFQGLARLFTKYGPPTELEAIVKGFNEALTKCPLVFADEQMPRINGRKMGSSELRGLIGTSSRTLNRKYVSASNLGGCIRLGCAANNDKMLVDHSDDNLSQEDLEATAERFLAIHVPVEAKTYLDSIGGYAGTRMWVNGDLIARHALWLRENRQVVPGKRFLVEGSMTSVHTNAMTSSGLRGAICDVLVSFVLRPSPGRSAAGRGILVGNGKLLAATTAVCAIWQHYVAYGKMPSTTAVGSQLKHLSTGSRRVRAAEGRRYIYHDIRLDMLYAWVEAHDVDDVDEIRQRIERVEDSWSVDDQLGMH